MLVFVFLNKDSENVHERSERMIFIFVERSRHLRSNCRDHKIGRVLSNRSGERTNAGRCFVALRSVKGNGTRTTSPWLKLIVDGILGIVPELECGLCRFEPGDIVR